MKRTHVHFAAGLPAAAWHVPNPPTEAAAAVAATGSAVISGIRSTCELLIYADVVAAIAGGIAFYRSANGVILVDSLPLAFFLRVEDLTQGGLVLFEHGHPVR
jgi:RNA 2'-phosphotransferase, Tpt1 / KptA family